MLGFLKANMKDQIKKIKKEYEEISEKLSDPEIGKNPSELQKISRRRAELARIISIAERLEILEKRLAESKELSESESDTELKNMADAEVAKLESEKNTLQKELKVSLLPSDPNDQKNVILEIRAGTGGDEAELFASELFRMYSRYAEKKGWKVDILNSSKTGIGGVKEIVATISGQEPYHFLKYESGVHRVQRVPKTEKSGRIHTSAATVAVLPEAEDVDIEIDQKDLRIDVFRSSGPGGQSVNTTDSAVRITHTPTNTVVSCQDEKSQLKNREKAMKIIRARLLEKKEEEERAKRGETRKMQVGTGDRSEKIRTYNFPQDRVTDHRIKLTVKNLPEILDGNLDKIISKLIEIDQENLLQNADPKSAD